MIALYRDIVARHEVPRGPRPRPARLESRREIPRAVTGLRRAEEETLAGCRAVSCHMVPPSMPPDIGQLTDIGDSGAEEYG
jgi:hypothetical protein